MLPAHHVEDMMTQKRQRRSAQFKFQVALDAAKETQTLSQLASTYGVQPKSPNGSASCWRVGLACLVSSGCASSRNIPPAKANSLSTLVGSRWLAAHDRHTPPAGLLGQWQPGSPLDAPHGLAGARAAQAHDHQRFSLTCRESAFMRQGHAGEGGQTWRDHRPSA